MQPDIVPVPMARSPRESAAAMSAAPTGSVQRLLGGFGTNHVRDQQTSADTTDDRSDDVPAPAK